MNSKFRNEGTCVDPDNDGSNDARRWPAVLARPSRPREDQGVPHHFHIKEKARAYARDQESDVARGEYVAPTAGDALFSSFGKRWINSRGGVDPASLIRYESIYRLHVEPKFGKRKVGSIRPSEIQEFLTALGERFGA